MNSFTPAAPFREIYRVNELPIFQNWMFDTVDQAKACIKGDIVLVEDLNTGLIYNSAFKPELMKYDAHYQNEQAISSVFRQHLSNVSELIAVHFPHSSLVEVGCGKGYFLEHLQARGFDVIGFDPTYEGTNPAVVKQFFTQMVGMHVDGVILRHVLEHVEDPIRFLSEICRANDSKGKIYIEVPCFDWICRRRAWFDIFYEHVNYFRLADFYRIFGNVYEAGRIFGGQYLYVVAELASIRTPSLGSSETFEFPENFLSYVERTSFRLKDAPSAIWGGASKGVTFALFMSRIGITFDLAIDINPAKHGKYLPATGLQVQSPEQGLKELKPGADIIVMNGNYLEEIRDQTQNRFNYLTIDDERI